MSDKHSPWQNAFQESFYSHFKVDLGIRTVSNVTEFIEAFISKLRIQHEQNSYLKTTPQQFQYALGIRQELRLGVRKQGTDRVLSRVHR